MVSILPEVPKLTRLASYVVLGKSGISKPKISSKTQKVTNGVYKLCACACQRSACISENYQMKSRGFNESKDTKTKRNKTKRSARERQCSSGKKMPGGNMFPLHVAKYLWRANRLEHANAGLSSSVFFPPRSYIRLHTVVQDCFSLQRPISP